MDGLHCPGRPGCALVTWGGPARGPAIPGALLLCICNPWMCISTNTRTYTRPRTHHDNVRDQYQCSCTARAHAPGVRDYLLVACPSHLLSCLGTRRWMYPMLARILSSGSINWPCNPKSHPKQRWGFGGLNRMRLRDHIAYLVLHPQPAAHNLQQQARYTLSSTLRGSREGVHFAFPPCPSRCYPDYPGACPLKWTDLLFFDSGSSCVSAKQA